MTTMTRWTIDRLTFFKFPFLVISRIIVGPFHLYIPRSCSVFFLAYDGSLSVYLSFNLVCSSSCTIIPPCLNTLPVATRMYTRESRGPPIVTVPYVNHLFLSSLQFYSTLYIVGLLDTNRFASSPRWCIVVLSSGMEHSPDRPFVLA
jgi:hypothetical protein